MSTEFKDKILNHEDKLAKMLNENDVAASKFLQEQDAKIDEYTPEDKAVIERATNIINGKKGLGRLQRVTTYKYKGQSDLEQTVVFEYPTACYLQTINLDKLDAEGYPTVNCEQLKRPIVTQSNTNTYSNHGKLIGSEVKDVSFSYKIVLAFVKNGCYRMIAQNVEGHSNRGYY